MAFVTTQNEHQIITLSVQKISLNLRQCKVGRSYRDYKALRAISQTASGGITPLESGRQRIEFTVKYSLIFIHLNVSGLLVVFVGGVTVIFSDFSSSRTL